MFLCSYSFINAYLFILQVSIARLLEAVDEVHFTDPKRGRISWIIEQNALPWSGQYYYTEAHGLLLTELLVVVDSSNGNHLGNCVSFAPRDREWRRFYWVLTEDALICNVTHAEAIVSKVNFPPSAPPRTFSVRILAAQGPRCFRDMIVQNEKLEGCPPSLKRNSFQQMSLECGCDNNDMIQQSFNKENSSINHGTFHFVNPNTFLLGENHPAFPNLRISPLPQTSKELSTYPPATITVPILQSAPVMPTWVNPSNVVERGTNDGNLVTNVTRIPSDEIQQNFQISNDLHQNVADHSNHQLPSINFFNGEPKVVPSEGPSQASNETPASASLTPTLNKHPCANTQCLNNGTCVVGGDGKALCLCPTGFAGPTCELNLCSGIQCLNDGVCYVIDNTPRCHCIHGTGGPFCEQLLCNPVCEQGGTCLLFNGTPVCRCPPGFAGVNCNVRDTCTLHSDACSIYGPGARCQMDPQSYILVSPVLVNATYKCLCNNNSEWTECSQIVPPHTPPAVPPIISITIPPVVHPTLANVDNHNGGQPRMDAKETEVNLNGDDRSQVTNPSQPLPNNGDTNSFSHDGLLNATRIIDTERHTTRSGEDTEDSFNASTHYEPGLIPGRADLLPPASATLPSMNLPEMHQHNVVENITRLSAVEEHNVQNPLSASTVRDNVTLEIPSDKTAETHTAERVFMPKLEAHTTEVKVTEEPPTMTTQGFEGLPINTDMDAKKASHFAQTETPSTPEIVTSTISHLFIKDGASSAHGTTDSVVPTLRMTWYHHTEEQDTTTIPRVIEIDGDEITLSPSTSAETETPSDFTEQVSLTTQEYFSTSDYDDQVKFVRVTIGLPTTAIPILVQGNRIADRNENTSKSSFSWAIVLSVVLVFIILATICGLLIFRYVRRSRKLHGKYNPAREENALSGSYSMPMTTVTKEERLI